MARSALISFAVLLTLCVGKGYKVFLRPSWEDLPRSHPFTLFMLLEDTQYSSSYSEVAFGQIKKGMTKEEVLKLLGEPLEIRQRIAGRNVRVKTLIHGVWEDSRSDASEGGSPDFDTESYLYSLPGSTDHWHVRAIGFSREGTVIYVGQSIYVD